MQGGRVKRKLTGRGAAKVFRASAFFVLSVAALALFFTGSVALAAVIDGTAGDDTLNGTSSSDSIFGHEGNDTIYGRGASDVLWGGLGSDVLWGHAGDDTLHGEGANDTLNGGPGLDELRGADGVDVLNGGADNDRLYDKDGNTAERDRFNCDTGEDFVHADPTDQVLNSCENVSFTGEDLLLEADWRMNEGSETSGQMSDSSGNNNHGTTTDVLQTGSTYEFNGSTSHVTVPHAESLNPLADDITLRARVMVTDGPMDDDSYDIVRKGFIDTPGGDYKMEIIRVRADPTVGRLHCLFRGDPGTTVSKQAFADIVDGNWHTLECVKTGNSVVARVDGKPYPQAGTAGTIANDREIMVGAKQVSPSPDDMFDGSMDFVSIDIAHP
jgi:RTX calcium-binding nonapeptide repeat (4 copies)/Concanavalin A-like lectin/glucanases superfamily